MHTPNEIIRATRRRINKSSANRRIDKCCVARAFCFERARIFMYISLVAAQVFPTRTHMRGMRFGTAEGDMPIR